MKLGKSKNITIIVGSFLLATVMALLVMLASIEPTIAQASTAGTRMSSGIDYSGQGTVINNDLSGKPATVEGNYVRIPTYGAYTYSTWDEFWAGWSSWSTSNKSYYDQKEYDYNDEHKICIIDAEKKTESSYYRDQTKTRDVYKTKYYRKYKGKHIFHWGHSSSSWNSYPTNKGCCSSTLETKWEKYGKEDYIERETSGYSFSKPFRWFWEPEWKVDSSRETYRYKSAKLSWNSKWKNDTSEYVPLNYSLYDQGGQPIGWGAKWTFTKSISQYKGVSQLGYADNLFVNEYYITAKEALELINDEMENIEDAVGNLGGVGILVDAVSIGAGIKYSNLIMTGIGIALMFVEGSDYLMNMLKSNQINSMQKLFKEAERQKLILAIQDHNYVGHGTYNSTYYQTLRYDILNKNYISMRITDNCFGSAYMEGRDNFGVVNYMTDVTEIVEMIRFSLKYNYPVFLPWNW